MKKDKAEQENITGLGKVISWVDVPSSLPKMIWALGLVCLLLFLADFIYHRHGHFEFEHLPGFYGFFGFIAFSCIVLLAKALRNLIGRGEDYYAPYSIDSETISERETEVKNHGE